MDASAYLKLGVHPDDAHTLVNLSTVPLSGHLTLVRSADAGLAYAAATLLARTRTASTPLDLHLAVSETDRWSVGEVEDLILRPARFKAFSETHIVVSDADKMTPLIYDKLLKTVEESISGAHFWFCLTDLDTLPATLRGRAGTVLTLRPTPPAALAPLLFAEGIDDQDVEVLLRRCGANARLALTAARHHEELTQALTCYAESTLIQVQPTTSSDILLAAVLTLGDHLARDATAEGKTPRKRRASKQVPAKAKVTPRPKWDSVPPAARAEARRLLAALLVRWRFELRRSLVSADSAEEVEVVEVALQALYQCQAELATNAPAALALPALRARVSSQG